MSREIKFKYIWSNPTKTNFLTKIFTLDQIEHGDQFMVLDNQPFFRDYRVIARLQSTNLLDKNDKEIFGGDVVRVNDDRDGDRTYEVIFKEGCYWGNCIYTPKPSTTPQRTLLCDLDYWDNESKEIIGNIYENPELITGVKNG